MSKLSTGKKIALLALIIVVLFGMIYGGLVLIQSLNAMQEENEPVTTENVGEKMANLLEKINVVETEPRKATITGSDILSEQDELPSIESYPLSVTNTTEHYIEIFSSPEKAGEGTDGWLNEVAEKFNAESFTVNGEVVSVAVRSVSSGLAVDYITSGKYVPDAFTPSNEYWGAFVQAKGVQITKITDRLVGNTAGILISNNRYNKLIEKYGAVNMKVITEATSSNEIAMGYTNPFVSSTGLNFLVSTLYAYDADNLLSDTAVAGFQTFQKNVPLVSYNTLQMREAAESGSLDAFILEYQSYVNDPTLTSDYKFTAFGIRHDNPLYQIGKLSDEKAKILNLFSTYCLSEESQKLASQYGFNGNENYKSELPQNIEGSQLVKAQSLYKENKDSGKAVMAVFVADISGSMLGDPLNSLKTSLLNSMQYINSENYIGLVSYNSKVYVNLPIGQFNLNQQAYFKGAVEDLDASGQTATNDALLVALNMLQEKLKECPDAKPMIFLLSDGEQNTGYSLNDISGVLGTYEIPVYTIGYNANIAALQRISEINEAATIDANSDDIVYQLKNLFNSQM
ncbi:MAG: VWA domain-containing protein [Acutalibacteraceae bacterium]